MVRQAALMASAMAVCRCGRGGVRGWRGAWGFLLVRLMCPWNWASLTFPNEKEKVLRQPADYFRQGLRQAATTSASQPKIRQKPPKGTIWMIGPWWMPAMMRIR